MSKPLEQAIAHIESRRGTTDERFRPWYHASVPVGWLNDPNGFCYFRGQYHLYYQHHPYDSVWGPMHWGHWVSGDLVHWRDRPIAIAPDQPFDEGGVFSGTSLVIGDKLYVFYTGVSGQLPQGGRYQQQCLAESTDGQRLDKLSSNPIIGADDLPHGASPYDFRDPKVFEVPGGYRMILASEAHGAGQLLAYDSKNLRDWSLVGVVLGGLSRMTECPDFFQLDGRDVLSACTIDMPQEGLRWPHHQPVVYMVGRMNPESAAFDCQEEMRTFDYGLDFYAPQSMLAPDGRRILIGWMLLPGRNVPTHTLGHGWAGVMTLPRECVLRGGVVCQQPARELELLRRDRRAWRGIALEGDQRLPWLEGRHVQLDLHLDLSKARRFCLHLLEDGAERFTIAYDMAKQALSLDRSACTHDEAGLLLRTAVSLPLEQGKLRLRVFVDTCSVEVFVNDGQCVLTSLVFPRGSGQGISFGVDGRCDAESITIWSMVKA